MSGQGGRYKMVVGVAEVVGLLARSFSQGCARCWGRLLRGWLGLAMVVGGNDRGVWLLQTKQGCCWGIHLARVVA